MKKILFSYFLIFLFAINLFAWREDEMQIRIFYSNQSELLQLQALKPKGDIYPNGEALVYLIPSELEALQATGLRYKVEKQDIKSYAENFWDSMDRNREAYHTYTEIVALADSLANVFPDICEKHLFGTSVEGRELGALKISDNVSLDENEAEILFDGGIHGDEIGAAENVIRFARDICLDYGIDPQITNLIDNREIWLYYMVNPDGRVADDRENANGVDLNRDSGYMWDAWGGSSGAFSQPESKALRDCHYNRQFVVHTTYHSGTEYISCPWSYRASQAPDWGHILQLAGEYSSSSGYANMEYGQGNSGMYAINGSTKDTNYGMMGAISWSMEISYDKDPPTSQIMMFYNFNKPAMLSMIEHSGYGLEGVVTDADTGEPVAAAVFVDDYFPTYTDVNAGDYHKYVLPGTYDITIVANGYETQTIQNVSVNANSSTATDFQLEPQEGHFVYKIASSRIPDNNPADEGDTPGVIGAPDSRNYSIGKNGWIVLDMQHPIIDGPGNDFIVYEGDDTDEDYSVFAGETIDGPWINLGDGSGSTQFDLAAGNLVEAQFIKILDDGDGSASIADAGFDLDAIEGITEISGVYIAFLGYELDEMIGNNNGYIDPGETIDMLVHIRNNGDETAIDTEGLLTSNSQNITMNNGDVNFGTILPGDEAGAIFTFTVNTTTPIGEILAFDLEITANNGAYLNNFDIHCPVGLSIEDFETAGFQSFEWEFDGNADWQISETAYEGTYSAQSGSINDQQLSDISLTTEVLIDGEISFFKKVSSENNYDYLRFYIDGTEMGAWCGEVDWSIESYPVTAGTHTFKWKYIKDYSVSSGSDCGWIDYITFPPMINNAETGFISGFVTLDGGAGNLEDVIVSAGNSTIQPDASGHFWLEILPGIYDVQASLTGYSMGIVEDVEVEANIVTENIDFELVHLAPPANLEAEVINYNSSIMITSQNRTKVQARTKARERDFLGYNIYLDGNFLTFIGAIPYDIVGPFGPGNIEIGISKVYDEGESEIFSITVIIELAPPENLNAESSGNDIVLSWEPPARGISEYAVYQNSELLATTSETTFTMEEIASGDYTFGVSVIYDGGFESAPAEITFEHTNSDETLLPQVTKLIGNYPNPFNPSTSINFSIEQNEQYELKIYNLKGQMVKKFYSDMPASGRHTVIWNGTDDMGKPVPSGIYFYQLKSKDFSQIKRMILLK